MDRPVLKILLLVMLCQATPSLAKLYRWVDSEGNVSYSDLVPPSEVGHERAVINKEGVVVESVNAQKSAAQRQRDQRLAQLRAEQRRLVEEQKAKDRVLLKTFATEDDVNAARDNKISAIDIIIQVTRGTIDHLEKQLLDLQKLAAQHERTGKKIPEKLQTQIQNSLQQIDGNRNFINTKRDEQHRIFEQFDADLKRFRELRSAQRPEQKLSATSPDQSDQTLSLFECANPSMCDRAWNLAHQYIELNSKHPVVLKTDQIVMTAPADSDDIITLTLSRARLEDNARKGEELFLDVQCRQSPKGFQLCASQSTDNMRRGFAQFIRDNLK